MPSTHTLKALASLIESRPPLAVAVVAKSAGDGASAGEPATLALSGDAKDFFYRVLDGGVAAPVRQDKWHLRPFDALYKSEPHEVEHVELDAVPAVKMATELYANLGPFAEFAGEDEFVKRLRYYVSVLGAPGSEQAFFFRNFTASAELERKRGAALLRRGAQFGVVEEKIFLFDEALDCVVFRGELFVLRKTDYRRIFDQFEILRQKAREAADVLHAQVPIANFDNFREACATQATMADKLVAIRSRDYFPTLTVEVLEPVIDEFSIDLEVVQEDGERRLVFRPDTAHRFLILKLLDDDYLRSSMTNNLYEANSKLPRQG